LIQNESHSLSKPLDPDFHLIVPRATPFHTKDLVLIHVPSGKRLVEGADYTLTHKFWAASHTIGTGVYGSILIHDANLTGEFRLTSYRTLGGDWTLNDVDIVEFVANFLLNPRVTYWEQIVNIPHQFPVVKHTFDIIDWYGASDIVDVLARINESILLSSRGKTLKGRSELPPIQAVSNVHGQLVTLDSSFTRFGRIDLDIPTGGWITEVAFTTIGGRPSGQGTTIYHANHYVQFNPVPVNGQMQATQFYSVPAQQGALVHEIYAVVDVLELAPGNFKNVIYLWLKDARLRSSVQVIDQTEASLNLMPVGHYSHIDAMTTFLPTSAVKFQVR
jgi:hypothetical protein